MAQFQYGAFQYGAFQYTAVPVWRCCNVSQFRRHVSMAHALCLDNNLYINDLQTEHSDCVNVIVSWLRLTIAWCVQVAMIMAMYTMSFTDRKGQCLFSKLTTALFTCKRSRQR